MTGSRKERQRTLNMTVKLRMLSTWKCGRVERMIIRHLVYRGMHETENYSDYSWKHTVEKWSGRAVCRVADMVRHLNLKGRARGELLDALKRLEKRYIIVRVET